MPRLRKISSELHQPPPLPAQVSCRCNLIKQMRGLMASTLLVALAATLLAAAPAEVCADLLHTLEGRDQRRASHQRACPPHCRHLRRGPVCCAPPFVLGCACVVDAATNMLRPQTSSSRVIMISTPASAADQQLHSSRRPCCCCDDHLALLTCSLFVTSTHHRNRS